MGLFCYLRSKRATAEQIADLKEEVRSVSEACNQWHGKWLDISELVDTFESRAEALKAELESVRAEANIVLAESNLRETRIAELQHNLGSAIKERDEALKRIAILDDVVRNAFGHAHSACYALESIRVPG